MTTFFVVEYYDVPNPYMRNKLNKLSYKILVLYPVRSDINIINRQFSKSNMFWCQYMHSSRIYCSNFPGWWSRVIRYLNAQKSNCPYEFCQEYFEWLGDMNLKNNKYIIEYVKILIYEKHAYLAYSMMTDLLWRNDTSIKMLITKIEPLTLCSPESYRTYSNSCTMRV